MLLYMGVQIPKEYDNPNWSKIFLQWLQEIEWAHTTTDVSGRQSLILASSLFPNLLFS